MSHNEKASVYIGESLWTLIFPFKYLDSYVCSLPSMLLDMLQNPFTSFIGINTPNEKFREELVNSLDKSLVLIVNPDDNKLEISTGAWDRLPTISLEDYWKISQGKKPSFFNDLTDDDMYWYEPFKDECKGDWELPNWAKVDSLKSKVEATVLNYKWVIFSDKGKKLSPNETDTLKVKLVNEVREHFLRYMVNLFKDYESCL